MLGLCEHHYYQWVHEPMEWLSQTKSFVANNDETL